MSNQQYYPPFSFSSFKASLKMINPVLITLIGALIVSTAVIFFYFPPGTSIKPDPINPVQGEDPNDPVGTAGISLANALIYVSIVLVGGVIFVVLLKYGLSRILEIALGLTMGFSSFLFTVIILPAILAPIFNTFPFLISLLGQTQEQVYDRFYALILLLAITLSLVYVFGLIFERFKNQYLHNSLMILFGISMGSIFGIFFESISLIVVLMALSLYDIYAVFKGPLKSMFNNFDDDDETINVEKNNSEIHNLEKTNYRSEHSDNEIEIETRIDESPVRVSKSASVNRQISNISLPIYTTPFISIGLGDFVFFSVLIAKATYFALKGEFLFLPITTVGTIYWVVILLPLLGVLLGCYLTFILLQKYEILPALPLPIFTGLAGLFIAILLYGI